MSVLQEGGNSAVSDDGTISARDGGISYSDRHPASVFPPSIHLARPLQTCWHIHHPSLTRQEFPNPNTILIRGCCPALTESAILCQVASQIPQRRYLIR